MEFLRYVIAFFVIGWGGAIVAFILFLITSPLISSLRNTDLGRVIVAATNGAGVFVAVSAFFAICRWTGGEAKLSMFALPLLLLLKNDIWRIRRAQAAHSVPGLELADDSDLRSGVVTTERMNLFADLIAFTLGILLHSGTAIIGGPDLYTKRLVARCVQEPMLVFQEYYSNPQVVPDVLYRVPVSQVLEAARWNRMSDLNSLSPEHRALVEARMEELASWIDMNTTVTATAPTGPFARIGGGLTTVELPDSQETNSMAKSMCIELFEVW